MHTDKSIGEQIILHGNNDAVYRIETIVEISTREQRETLWPTISYVKVIQGRRTRICRAFLEN